MLERGGGNPRKLNGLAVGGELRQFVQVRQLDAEAQEYLLIVQQSRQQMHFEAGCQHARLNRRSRCSLLAGNSFDFPRVGGLAHDLQGHDAVVDARRARAGLDRNTAVPAQSPDNGFNIDLAFDDADVHHGWRTRDLVLSGPGNLAPAPLSDKRPHIHAATFGHGHVHRQNIHVERDLRSQLRVQIRNKSCHAPLCFGRRIYRGDSRSAAKIHNRPAACRQLQTCFNIACKVNRGGRLV